jgi:hypothetical protein
MPKNWMKRMSRSTAIACVTVLGLGLCQAISCAQSAPQAGQPEQQQTATATQTQPTGQANTAETAAVAGQTPAKPGKTQQTIRLASRSEMALAAKDAAPLLAPGKDGEHPLMPVLRWAYSGVGEIEKIQDYSAVVAKRERVGGEVMDYQYMSVKLRQKPFSVYLNFLGPQKVKGQQAIYVEGQNEGKMLAHGVGLIESKLGWIPLEPDGRIAMRNQVYPLTELGILNLTKRLVEVGEQDIKYGECEVKFYEGAKITDGHGGQRVCTCIEVIHPTPRQNFRFHKALIFVDKELNLPIRYASYDWPKKDAKNAKDGKDGKDAKDAKDDSQNLLEEYTYLNIKLNNGFTDEDFNPKNPKYNTAK